MGVPPARGGTTRAARPRTRAVSVGVHEADLQRGPLGGNQIKGDNGAKRTTIGIYLAIMIYIQNIHIGVENYVYN